MPPSPTADARNPRLPSDLGLPNLGLLMQLIAGVSSCYGAIAGYLIFVSPMLGVARVAAVAIVVAGWVRGVFHQIAGRQVMERSADMRAAVNRYLIASAVTTVVMVVIAMVLTDGELPPVIIMVGVVVAAAWPITLMLLMRRPAVQMMFSTAETFEMDIRAPDRSIEGAGILMTAFGAIGVGIALILAYVIFAGNIVGGGIGGMLIALFIMSLFARSVLHLVGGIQASAGVPPETFTAIVGRYRLAAMISVIVLGVMLFLVIILSGGRGAVLPVLVFGTIFGILLYVWPLTLGRFVDGMQTTGDIFDAPVVTMAGPAPDRGLTAFGYLLLVFGTLGAIGVMLQLTVATQLGALIPGMRSASLVGAGDMMMSLASTGTTIWAGVELVMMSRRYKIAMIVYASVALGTTLLAWLNQSPFAALSQRDMGFDQTAALTLLGAAVSLIMPTMALVLMNRRLPARG